jgi:hypothetical protein
VEAIRNATFNQLYDDLTELCKALSPDTGNEATQRDARSFFEDNEEVVRDSFRAWQKLGLDRRHHLLKQDRRLDSAAAEDGFLTIAENALEEALDTGPLRAPVTEDAVNMIRRVVDYAAYF